MRGLSATFENGRQNVELGDDLRIFGDEVRDVGREIVYFCSVPTTEVDEADETFLELPEEGVSARDCMQGCTLAWLLIGRQRQWMEE